MDEFSTEGGQLEIRADATFTDTTPSNSFSSSWLAPSDGPIALDGTALSIAPGCRGISWRGTVYYRPDRADSCPVVLEPLSALEKCFIGKFEDVENAGLFDFDNGPDRVTFIYVALEPSEPFAFGTFEVEGIRLRFLTLDRTVVFEYSDAPAVSETWDRWRKTPLDPGCVR